MTAVVFAVAAIFAAGVIYSWIRNGRHIMADLDEYETRTCPPVNDHTRFLKIIDDEYGHE